MTFPDTLTIRFDPLPSLFSHDEARTFYLLWRYCHIVGNGFDEVAQHVGDLIQSRTIETPMDLANCLRDADVSEMWLGSPVSWPEWCDAALPYFTGEKSIGYRHEP